jgi:hypothetical protein
MTRRARSREGRDREGGDWGGEIGRGEVKGEVGRGQIGRAELAAVSDDRVPCKDDRSVSRSGPLSGTCQISTRPPWDRVMKMGRYGWKLPWASACVCERTTRWPTRLSRAVFQKSTTPLCRVAARLAGLRGWCDTETTMARSSFAATPLISRAVSPQHQFDGTQLS